MTAVATKRTKDGGKGPRTFGEAEQLKRPLYVPEGAGLLGVTVPRMYQLIRENIVPAIHLGRSVRLDVGMLRQFCETGGKKFKGGWRRREG